MNSPITLIVGGLSLAFGFSVVTTGLELSSMEPRTLNLEALSYNGDGTVTQKLSGGIPADWAAQITRDVDGVDIVLCSGFGRGPVYNGVAATFTADDWTFDDCPELQAGDVGKASWEYVNENNVPVSITGRFIVGE